MFSLICVVPRDCPVKWDGEGGKVCQKGKLPAFHGSGSYIADLQRSGDLLGCARYPNCFIFGHFDSTIFTVK